MKALAVLVLLATAAHADDEVADDYDPLLALRRSFTERDGSGCLDHLGVLRARGVPDTTTIRFYKRRGLPNGLVPLSTIRVVCEDRMREHATREAEDLVMQAIRFPWSWAERCVDRWPLALAAGASPKHRVSRRVRSRRGWVVVKGTLAELYERHCENAYTPRRRNE